MEVFFAVRKIIFIQPPLPECPETHRFRAMPIYVYETTGEKPRRFEVKQSMKDAPLSRDPETGEPVRRVISGGYGFIEKGKSSPAPAGRGPCCGGGGCGCH
jgi:predicted nucleic acid-binding Zn ribbon protein